MAHPIPIPAAAPLVTPGWGGGGGGVVCLADGEDVVAFDTDVDVVIVGLDPEVLCWVCAVVSAGFVIV
jgi:hypothetical protein